MKEFFKNFTDHPHMPKRMILCFISVSIMGFCVYWLDRLAWGTDPCSTMTLALSAKVGLSLGTFQALFNTLLFVIVLLKDKKQIGFGTLFNMFVVGYAYNFMAFCMKKLGVDYHFPKVISLRILLMVWGVTLRNEAMSCKSRCSAIPGQRCISRS